MRKFNRSRAVRGGGFFAVWALGAAGVGSAPACNFILDNQPAELATSLGGSTASGGSQGGSHAGSGGSSTAGTGTGSSGKSGTGGTPGVGGMGASAGSGASAGAAAGAGGAPTVCTNPLLIDDLEDGENTLAPCGSRVGYWFVYNDYGQMDAFGLTSLCSQTPPPQPAMNGIPFPPTAGGNAGSRFAVHTKGSGCTVYGAGVGFDFENVNTVSTTYDAHLYRGISLWVKGSISGGGRLAAQVPIPATAGVANPPGKCVPSAGFLCEDHYTIHLVPAAIWLQYSITFADSTTFAQSGFGLPVAFDPSHVIGMRFQTPANTNFEFWIDDLAFFY